MSGLLLVLGFAGCQSLPSTAQKVGKGARMPRIETRRFPEDIKGKSLSDEEALERSRLNKNPSVQVTPHFEVNQGKLSLTCTVVNDASVPQSLLVNPVSTHPSGQPVPLVMRFTESSRKHVRFVGEALPPEEPPLPMEIDIPGMTKLVFETRIDLKDYAYVGLPTVEVEWSFTLFGGSSPHGVEKVVLPVKKAEL